MKYLAKNATPVKRTMLPCDCGPDQYELQENTIGLEIACKNCAKAVTIVKRCACGEQTKCHASAYGG